MQLLGGFSPVNAIKQAGSVLNPTGGVANYDVFTNLGNQRSSTTNSQLPDSAYNGATGYWDGQAWEYRDGGWSPVGGAQNANTSNPLGGGGSGSGGTSSSVDPQALAMYDQGIGQTNSALERLLAQQNVGQQNIEGDYNTGLKGLNTTRARTETDYNENKINTTKENIAANSNIDFNTGRQANSLQRLLGSRGAGSSSAARVAAPYAAALQGSQQRDQVKDAFTQNMTGLDKSWNLFDEDWRNSLDDLGRQKKQNESALESDILSRRSSLLQTLAELQSQRQLAAGGNAAASVAAAQPYLNQINGLQDQIVGLGARYQGKVNAKAPVYAAPDLAKYDYDSAGAARFNNTSALTDTVNPYLSVLLGADKKKQPTL